MTVPPAAAPAAWIVGAGGIGAAIRDRLAGEYRTVTFDRAGEPDHMVDVRDRSALSKATRDAADRYGPPRVVVLAFGTVSPATVEDAGPDEVADVVGDNLIGCVNVLHAVHHTPRAQTCTAVVVSSNAAHLARPRQPLYAATKAAVTSLVRSLAVGWAPEGIRLIGVLPGTVTVPRNADRVAGQYPDAPRDPSRPGGRLVQPAELAGFVAGLLPYAGHLTGQSLTFDGGSTLGAAR
ncbi:MULTISPECIES: SDR family oxidoreductase [Actinoplanes]|uniref:SDR family NAD(P)-dependent oxidoreductase n=1 Tax=Actinoplanes TaxID=1865 RepID=UPI0006980541|nr:MULTISPECIES: SDR family oxidoreductase [Actinoplanes]GLY04036.1 3-oxoacyl-ACP reductase [Actinoplanes sp. NBRC 101535]